MLESLDHIRMRNKLLLLITILITGVFVTALVSYLNLLQKLKIQGPYYEKIIEGQELLADVKPSRLDLTRAYLLAFQEAVENQPEKLEKLIQESESFYQEFEQLTLSWMEKFPQQALDTQLLNSLHIAEDFFKTWRTEFLPTLKERNQEASLALLNGKLKQLYSAQQRAIEQTTHTLKSQNQAVEEEVYQIFISGRRLALISWALTIIATIFFAYLIGRSMTRSLNDALKQMSSVSTEINSHMNQQAQSVAQQSDSADQTTSAMNELNTSFQHTHMLAQESSNRAKKALQVSEEGNNLIKQLVEEMLEHKEKVADILEQILHLSEIINRIHSVASTINNLTNQTNILALNAAVQAAHVKQSSEGFSVISGEIRKLADESKKFVAHIDELAENIKNATHATVRIAQEGSQTVQDCIKLAQSSSKAFDTIISITNNSFEGAEQVSLNIEQQSQAVHRVLKAMEILNVSAHQNLINMNEVRAEVSKLNQLSEELKSII